MIKIVNKISDHNNLIVFIHGFVGSQATWVKDENMPFVDLLLQDEQIKKNFNIGIFEYHSELLSLFPKIKAVYRMIGGKKNPFNLPIDRIAELLESQLRWSYSEYENIILIGHSMGGLVAKRFVLNDILKNSTTRVKLYVSLATPHSGSNLANIGSLLIENVQTKDLQPLSESIAAMSNDWVQCMNLPKRLYAQGTYDVVVPRVSSVPFDRDTQDVIYSDDDHFSIIQPITKSVIIDAITHELHNLLKEQKIESIAVGEPFVDIGQFDEEKFVLKLLMAEIHATLLSGSKQAFFDAEFATRQLYAQGVELKDLIPLYNKIRELYGIEFGNLLNGKHKDSNALLTAVHSQILSEDKLYLVSLYPVLQSLQKFGMLQQLASKQDDIWWAQNNDIKTFEAFVEKFKNQARG